MPSVAYAVVTVMDWLNAPNAAIIHSELQRKTHMRERQRCRENRRMRESEIITPHAVSVVVDGQHVPSVLVDRNSAWTCILFD
jgi:hypothetical protein